MPDKVTAPKIRAMKARGERIVCVTAYDFTSGSLADAAGVDLILVGDSVANTMLGYSSTVPVTLEQMVHHVKATRAGVSRALLVADMPFGSYQASTEQAVATAVTLMKAGAEAVKLEGPYTEAIAAITKAGIPLMGHVGMTPQSVHSFGGPRVQGKGNDGDRVLEDTRAVSDAGAFAIVLELIPSALAQKITSEVDAPTIGIGAGPFCDGEIQVFHDILGLSEASFKHTKAYVPGRQIFQDALVAYTKEVRDCAFPTTENSF